MRLSAWLCMPFLYLFCRRDGPEMSEMWSVLDLVTFADFMGHYGSSNVISFRKYMLKFDLVYVTRFHVVNTLIEKNANPPYYLSISFSIYKVASSRPRSIVSHPICWPLPMPNRRDIIGLGESADSAEECTLSPSPNRLQESRIHGDTLALVRYYWTRTCNPSILKKKFTFNSPDIFIWHFSLCFNPSTVPVGNMQWRYYHTQPSSIHCRCVTSADALWKYTHPYISP